MGDPNLISVSPAVRQAFAPILQAAAPARQDLAGEKHVVAVRPGYKYPADTPPQPALVVAVTPGERPVAVADLEKKYGVPAVVTDATVESRWQGCPQRSPCLSGLRGAGWRRPSKI
jgi:hypothetical protein